MGQKKPREKTADELQTERVTTALEETDRTGRAPALVRENPGQFLRDMYDVWHRQGGKEGGRWRNSIRKMRDEWLVGRHAVPSLHPKLMGRVKVTRSDARALIGLFLERWRYGEGGDALSSMTGDGYVGFAVKDRRALREFLLRALMKLNELGAGIAMPEQRREQDTVEETKRRWVNVEQVMRESDALITLSRHRIAVGKNSIETMTNFWHLLNHLYKDNQENYSSDRIFIWVIDMGSRLAEQDFSFDEYFNAGLLALQFQSFATFDSLGDYEEGDRSRLFPRMQIAESVHRDQRWEWLSQRTVVVAQNLRLEEFEGLYEDQGSAPKSIRLKDIGVTSEHILPNKTPREWVKQLRSLYGRDIEAADATFTVFYNELHGDSKTPSKKQAGDLRYFAHTPVSEDRRSSDQPLPNVALSIRSVELESPGHDYDNAFRLLYWAARLRLGLGDESELQEGLTALAYIRKHGFQFLLLEDFLQIFLTKN